ncbi:MAG: TonB-dependent receptor [Ignavibacteriales bacterium]|nr:TonB-dependent receptor [Ignavibacteriales bacterium]
MKQLKKEIAYILLLTIVLTSLLWSGTTGKIAGTITDKANGESLIGANVVVVGTSFGAAADINGQYSILSVPPGTYKVQISFIGYETTVINDVRVYIDQTARIDVALGQQTINADEVVVVAERTTIKPDVATSVSAVSGKEIESLPVSNVVSAIGLQAGVRGGWSSNPIGAAQPTFARSSSSGRVSVQGGLSIRGGGGDNILFMVDGVTMRDPRNNEPTTEVSLSSVKEISVERGGFSAEYGQVRSGVINVVTREGARQGYFGSVQTRVSPPAPKYYRGTGILDILDPNSFVLRPYFDPAVCWTGTDNGAWDEWTKKKYPSFDGWNNISQQLNSDNNPNNDLTPMGAQRAFEYEIRKRQPNNQPDYDIDGGFGGPIPFVSEVLGNLRFFTSYRSTREMLLFPLTRPDYSDYDWSLQVNSDITSSMKLRVSATLGKQYTIENNWDYNGSYFYPRTPGDIAGVVGNNLMAIFSDYNFCLADIGKRSLSAKLTNAINSRTFYEISLENFRRDYNVRPTALRNTSQIDQILPGFTENGNPFGYYPINDYTDGVYIKGGSQFSRVRDFTVVNSTTLKADISSQINFQNLVKAGVEFLYNDLNFDYGQIADAGQPAEKYINRVQMRAFPVQASVYLQDKLEFKEFTVNAGLRLDYINSNTDWWNVDPYSSFFADTVMSTSFSKTKSTAQWQLSPRLGISHPISENAKLFFNYGHFKQVPQYESIFRIQRKNFQQMTSFGNPNIILAKTISYELGFDYVVFNDYLIQMAGFYNDITNQQGFTTYTGSAGFSYTEATSNNYQDVRGFELTIRKTTGRWWSGFVNYTYQVSTSGHFGSAQQFDDIGLQKSYDETTVNIYQDRPLPQPYARANLNLFSPQDFGPTIFGHNILGSIGLNIVLDWQDGPWTTWNPGDLSYVAYNVKAVDYFNTTLRVDKTVSIGKFRIQLFMDVNNLFNTLRLSNNPGGDQDYMKSLHFPKSKDYPNMVGDDKVGDYRTLGVEFQPMQNGVPFGSAGKARLIYYDNNDRSQTYGKYFEYMNNQWSQVDQNRIDKIISDKAYIDMPNASTYWFLDPRKIYFGLKLSFDFTD